MNTRTAALEAIGEWAGIKVPPTASEVLRAYEDWLRVEGIKAGGLGPNEASRLWNRHVLDSCVFAGFTDDFESAIDIGSGLGLPGIPLAIMRPRLRVTLLDKAQRRSDLTLRAVRMLKVANVDVVNAPIESYRGRHDVVVSRAALPSERLEDAARKTGSRKIVVAASRTSRPVAPGGWEIVEIPEHLLGERAWMIQTWISEGESG